MNNAARQEHENNGRDARGRFLPGFTLNTKGIIKSKRYERLYAELASELGELNAVDTALLSQAVNLMCRAERTKSGNDAVRCANAASRLLAMLRDGRKREPLHVPPRNQEYAEP